MSVLPCHDLSAANWLQTSDRPWNQLVTLGPAGYDAYARLRFIPDPTHPGQSEGDVDFDPGPDAPSENDQMRSALTLLTTHTTTERCYFAIWDGWGLLPIDKTTARLQLPNRNYFLFDGAVADLGDGAQWNRVLSGPAGAWPSGPDPAFVWPADRTWCLTKDVDPHYATIAASSVAITALLNHPGLDIVPADLAEEPLHYL
ncbi:hypothetical protein OG218_02335 [Kineococcus sp. NBC_00420]|uniref:hypothetical protein n=1 Tax=Kineococcus sp. NBC_00420 TaxID=2903564 RepID=UPI002E1E512B